MLLWDCMGLQTFSRICGVSRQCPRHRSLQNTETLNPSIMSKCMPALTDYRFFDVSEGICGLLIFSHQELIRTHRCVYMQNQPWHFTESRCLRVSIILFSLIYAHSIRVPVYGCCVYKLMIVDALSFMWHRYTISLSMSAQESLKLHSSLVKADLFNRFWCKIDGIQ